MTGARVGTGIGARLLVAATLLSLFAVSGCGSPPAPVEISSPFAACPTPQGGPSGSPSTGGAPAAGDAAVADPARPLPAVSLPCFTGGEQVTLSTLGRPMVINFWASFCQPCRTELPELQRFADAAGDRVLVLGVITTDTRTAAAAAGEDFQVRFPSVFDADGALRRAWGRNVLPITLFVDARGQVRHEDVSGALTQERIATLAAQYLGVTR